MKRSTLTLLSVSSPVRVPAGPAGGGDWEPELEDWTRGDDRSGRSGEPDGHCRETEVSWWIDWLPCWWIARLIVRLIDCHVDWLPSWWIARLINCPVDCQVDWLSGWLMSGWLTDSEDGRSAKENHSKTMLPRLTRFWLIAIGLLFASGWLIVRRRIRPDSRCGLVKVQGLVVCQWKTGGGNYWGSVLPIPQSGWFVVVVACELFIKAMAAWTQMDHR